MRKTWARLIHEEMKHDKDIVVITPDMGYGVLDKIRDDFPDRYFNVGIAEALATNVAVGMSLAGKKPWVYGIITFTLYKGLEQIRNYVVELNLPIKYALVGKDKTYAQLDRSHWATEDKEIAEAIGFPYFEPNCKENLEIFMKTGEDPLGNKWVKPCGYIRMP